MAREREREERFHTNNISLEMLPMWKKLPVGITMAKFEEAVQAPRTTWLVFITHQRTFWWCKPGHTCSSYSATTLTKFHHKNLFLKKKLEAEIITYLADKLKRTYKINLDWKKKNSRFYFQQFFFFSNWKEEVPSKRQIIFVL